MNLQENTFDGSQSSPWRLGCPFDISKLNATFPPHEYLTVSKKIATFALVQISQIYDFMKVKWDLFEPADNAYLIARVAQKEGTLWKYAHTQRMDLFCREYMAYRLVDLPLSPTANKYARRSGFQPLFIRGPDPELLDMNWLRRRTGDYALTQTNNRPAIHMAATRTKDSLPSASTSTLGPSVSQTHSRTHFAGIRFHSTTQTNSSASSLPFRHDAGQHFVQSSTSLPFVASDSQATTLEIKPKIEIKNEDVEQEVQGETEVVREALRGEATVNPWRDGSCESEVDLFEESVDNINIEAYEEDTGSASGIGDHDGLEDGNEVAMGAGLDLIHITNDIHLNVNGDTSADILDSPNGFEENEVLMDLVSGSSRESNSDATMS